MKEHRKNEYWLQYKLDHRIGPKKMRNTIKRIWGDDGGKINKAMLG